jgi:hypothetical protein
MAPTAKRLISDLGFPNFIVDLIVDEVGIKMC